MIIRGAVHELLHSLALDGDPTIPWEQVCRWPQGAIAIFENAGWLDNEGVAEIVQCPGCEENCLMPVEVFARPDERGIEAFVACEYRNFGRINIPPERLSQWRTGRRQIAGWIARALGVRYSGKRLDGGNLLELGLVSGKKRAQMLCLDVADRLMLAVGSARIPLVDAIELIDGNLSVNMELVRRFIDSAATGDPRYIPSTARREARKLETAKMYKQWQKEYRALKRRRPRMSDAWYSKEIAKLACANGRSAETIRKNMK